MKELNKYIRNLILETSNPYDAKVFSIIDSLPDDMYLKIDYPGYLDLSFVNSSGRPYAKWARNVFWDVEETGPECGFAWAPHGHTWRGHGGDLG